MSRPIAVLISDIHYNIHTLKLADAAMRQAIAKANDLNIPLIVAGDLHDTKANLRGECVNVMLDTFRLAKIKPHILIGNHDKINEKSDSHSLNFLSRFCYVHDNLQHINEFPGVCMLPYQCDPSFMVHAIKILPKGSILIMHQGIIGSNSGEYIQDKSAITKEDVSGMRVISGHYHTRQTIKLPDGGSWDYIGNPYTLSFGEANDPPKGFQILMDDGSLEFVSTNLRKHVVIETYIDDLVAVPYQHEQGDLLWFKCEGTKEQLMKITKQLIADNYGITEGFKLDLIPLDTKTNRSNETKNLTQSEILDSLIDSLTNTGDDTKTRLKQTWKELI